MRFAAAVLVAMTMTTVAAARPAKTPKPPKPARWQTLAAPTDAMPAAASIGVVESDGASIYYAVYGTTGDPVILLHGGMGNGDHWVLQIPALAPAHQVITIDGRGQGRSSRPKAKPTYDAMANDVIAVMDALKLPKASIVGWSDGGEIGLKLAIEHAARVDKLFVMGANYDSNGSKPRGGKPSSTFSIYSARCRKDYEKQSKTPKQFSELVQWLLPLWKNPMGFTKDQLAQIKAPTMVADGDHDEIIELAQIKEMAKLIPNAKLYVFEDTSHFVLWQDPASLNAVLVDFLTAN